MVLEGRRLPSIGNWRARRVTLLSLAVLLALLLTAVVAACRNWTGFGFDRRGPEMQRIREALQLREGMTIADIGAGKGQLSAALASEVGTRGRIFATDVDRERVEALREKFRDDTLTNVVVVEGGTSDTRLPHACCDAIVLRRVYHHLTDTAQINASMFRSLRPGGVLAIIDFPPPLFLNRGEFGVPANAVIGEVAPSGFELLRLIDDWPGREPLGSYCVLFRKPR
jgi:ubiquinone/menaquinone biosynthesis C-methylase UbiE